MEEYKITQVIDNGNNVQITMIENIHTESISHQQMIIDGVKSKLPDDETKKHILPILDAILSSQPTTTIQTYQGSKIIIIIPKVKYDRMNQPRVGDILKIDINN